MAVTKVSPRWQDRGGSTDENGVRTLTRGWRVQTDDDDTGEPEVVDAVIAFDASAALYAPHPKWAWAVCRKITPKPAESARLWIVTAEYSSAAFKASGDGSGGGGNTTAPSPEQSNSAPANERPPTVKVAGRNVSKVLEKDAVTGDRVLNTVGYPFDPPPEVPRSHDLITWTFFRAPDQLNWGARGVYRDSVNNAAVVVLGRTYPAGTLRCTAYDLDTVWETGEEGMALFFQLTVQAEHEPDGWQPQVLNTGRRKAVYDGEGAFVDVVAVVDSAGQPVADPAPLDEFGVPVPPGGDYHYVTPMGYVPRDWSNLLA